MSADHSDRSAPSARSDRFEVLTFPSWAELWRRLPRLLIGIAMLGLGIALLVRAKLGVAPWDVFHQGVAKKVDLGLGTVIIVVGFVVLLAWIPLRQRFGLGTIVNTFGVGLVVDVSLRWVPTPHDSVWRWALLIGGTVVISFGTALYIGAGLGPGPRDGLMTALATKGVSLWVVRTVLELGALVAGWVLGGNVGVGTVLFAFGIGPLAHLFLEWIPLPASGTNFGPGLAGD